MQSATLELVLLESLVFIAGVELILEMVRTALNVVDNALVAFLRYFLSRIKLSVFK
ncbi:hypothetical protein [Acinetobacter calcoaceticus]|uniref:hypothetical protein n=1 Tax=Acinetobacter calcoaceticus TaxID=471 RepID=UPI003A6FD4D0